MRETAALARGRFSELLLMDRGTRTRWTGALFCFVLAAMILAVDLPVLHDHSQAGLYAQDCSLGRLAAGAPRGPLADPMAAPRPLPACGVPAPTPGVEPAPPPLAPCAPRAPPASSGISV
jgi:hypothetical protein